MLKPHAGEDPNVPPCPFCPMILSSQPTLPPNDPARICTRCGAHRATLYEIEPEKLLVPDITFDDFIKALKRTRPSVATEELDRFEKWTEEFGE